ncbi:MAG: hypothetical protein Q8R21_04280, partial [Burkholderiales bacterium]|nr:hypothetical protein [Burkholderiales bacterium]
GSGCEIESGVTIIGPTWIGNGSRVCAGSRLSRSVLFDYTCVQPASEFDDMIVCGNYAADRDGNSVHVAEASGRQTWRDARAGVPVPTLVAGEAAEAARATASVAAQL